MNANTKTNYFPLLALGTLGPLLIFLSVFVYLGGYQNVGKGKAAPASGNVANFNTINYGTALSDSNNYQLMDLQYNGNSQSGTDGTRTVSYYTNQRLHATNPNAKLLMYADVMDSRTPDWTACIPLTSWSISYNGTTYSGSGANANESWFVHDTTSATDGPANRIVDSSKTLYMMDVNNAGYQTECARHALSRAAANGFDGVFFDDMGWFGWYHWYDYANATSSSTPTQLSLTQFKNYSQNCPASPYGASNPCPWESGLANFAAHVAPSVRAVNSLSGQPLIVIGNTGPSYGGNYQSILGPLDGYMEESWTSDNSHSCSTDANCQQDNLTSQVYWWNLKSGIADWAAANGKYMLGHSYETTESGNTYGLAATMLFDNGRASYSTSNTNYTAAENWYGEYCTATQLGAPAGGYTTFSSGSATIYKRTFANGQILVNPGNGTSASIPLDASYSYAKGSLGSTPCPSGYPGGLATASTSAVTLGPTSAYILYKPSAAPVAAPTVSLSANPSSVTGGSSSTLSWSSSNASTCSAASPAGWMSGGTSGSKSVSPGITTTYSLSCSGPGGSASASATVTVSGAAAPPPSAGNPPTPVVVGNGSSTPTVSGIITLGTNITGVVQTTYYVDGKRLNSPAVNTNDLADGTHTIEVQAVKADGQVITEKEVIKVNNHHSILKNFELRYGKLATAASVTGVSSVMIIAVALATYLLVLHPRPLIVQRITGQAYEHADTAAKAFLAKLPKDEELRSSYIERLPKPPVPGSVFKPKDHDRRS